MSGYAVRVAVLAELVALAKAIDDRASLGKIYERLVGYDAAKDDPEAGAEELRSLILDVAREECVNLGIPVMSIGIVG